MGVRTHEPGPAGWIGSYLEGAQDLPEGGWTLDKPEGESVQAGEASIGMAVLIKGKSAGLWSVDRVLVTYEQDGAVHEQTILVGADVCVGGDCR